MRLTLVNYITCVNTFHFALVCALNNSFRYTSGARMIPPTKKINNMSNKNQYNPDYIRAVKILKDRIHTPADLIRFWAFSGPCIEPHPEIEDISE